MEGHVYELSLLVGRVVPAYRDRQLKANRIIPQPGPDMLFPRPVVEVTRLRIRLAPPNSLDSRLAKESESRERGHVEDPEEWGEGSERRS